MKRRTMIIVLFFLSIMMSLAQKSDDCFNIDNWEFRATPDSNKIKNLYKDVQLFYDKSINCKAPDFKIASINGDTIELDKLKGKVVVINFWFVECSGCIAEISDINKLVEEYKNKDVVFISMARNSKAELINDTITRHKLKSIVIPNCQQIADKYCVIGYPATFILNEKCRLEKALSGNGKLMESDISFYDKMKKIIDSLL